MASSSELHGNRPVGVSNTDVCSTNQGTDRHTKLANMVLMYKLVPEDGEESNLVLSNWDDS